jgi:pimeloyl-ACP methyl ester carboxylesterase
MSTLRAEGLVSPAPFDLSGFSGGAQFAHRFTWLYPAMVARLCVASPGWWTFPDTETAWPMGMANGGKGEDHGFHLRANLGRFLDRSITICVGSDDTTRDENLRKSAAMDAQQGAHRVARATRWRMAMVAAARREDVTPRIDLRVLPGCGHDFVECATLGGLDRDFIASSARCAGSPNLASFRGGLRTAHPTQRISA